MIWWYKWKRNRDIGPGRAFYTVTDWLIAKYWGGP